MDFRLYPPNSLPDRHVEWTQAVHRVEQADPFCCTPEWQMSFHDAFSPGRRLMVESSSNNVIAFAEYKSPAGLIYLTPIESHWLFGCPLLGVNAVELLADHLPKIEALYKPEFPRILISGIRPEGILPPQLFRHLGHHFDFFLHSSGIQCSASLEGGVDGFLSRRSGNHRKKLKKQFRVAKDAGIYFERVIPSTPEEAEQTYARMIAVERKSWKGIGKCGMTETPAKEFYDSMMYRLAKIRSGRIIFTRHEDTDIGFIFGGTTEGIYRGQQFSYDEAWKDYSAGNLMQVEKVKWLCEEGALRYDMGPIVGPKMGYKKHWTETGFKSETWVLAKK